MNSTTNAPVTISVIVPAVDNAPLVSLSWLLRSAWIAELPALSICCLLRCAGPLINQLRAVSMLWVTCSISPGKPSMNWLTTNDRMPPRTASPNNSSNNTAQPRGTPWLSSQSTPGRSNAVSIPASATGTKISCRCLTTHSNASTATKITSRRQAHAAVLRTSWDDGCVFRRWHAGSVAPCSACPAATAGTGPPARLPCTTCPKTRRRAPPAAGKHSHAANIGGCDGWSSVWPRSSSPSRSPWSGISSRRRGAAFPRRAGGGCWPRSARRWPPCTALLRFSEPFCVRRASSSSSGGPRRRSTQATR